MTGANGLGAKATIVVSSNTVSSITITDFGYGYDIGDTISVDDLNIGNAGGSGLNLTLTQVVERSSVPCSRFSSIKRG